MVTLAQLDQEQEALDWCRTIGDHELESEYCNWLQRWTGRQPGSAVPVSAPTPRPAASSSPSCGCPTGDRTIRDLAAKVINEHLGGPTPNCWQCAELGRQCYACEQVAKQNRHPAAYR